MLTFAFSRGEPGYDLLTTHAGATLKKLVRRGCVSIWFIDRADHIFADRQPRCESIGKMVRHLAQRYRAST
ncbi:hypothetical protein D3C83_263030 [compost metagenome]